MRAKKCIDDFNMTEVNPAKAKKYYDEGENFYKNIKILKSWLNHSQKEFWDGFVKQWRKCLYQPKEEITKQNKLTLWAYIYKLQKEMKEQKPIIDKKANRLVCLSLFGATIGAATMLSGLSAFTAIGTLALGPFGVIALTLGVAMLGLIIIGISMISFDSNRKIIKDGHLDEIKVYASKITGLNLVTKEQLESINITKKNLSALGVKSKEEYVSKYTGLTSVTTGQLKNINIPDINLSVLTVEPKDEVGLAFSRHFSS